MTGHYLKYISSTAMGLFSSNSSLIEWPIISPFKNPVLIIGDKRAL